MINFNDIVEEECKYNFKEINEIKPLIESEGPILSIVELEDENNNFNERIYLKATCLNGDRYIYTKVNFYALELFFKSRISVKELFLLRMDEFYILEKADNYANQIEYFYDDHFKNIVIDSIECGDYYFNQIDKNMRDYDPFNDTMKFLDMMYINGVVTIRSEWSFDPYNY